MIPSRNEQTIASACEVSGRAYWSGSDVTVTINPAPDGTGVRLVRADLASRPSCAATVEHRSDAALRTNLQQGDAKFQLVEHLMAALFSLEIDNCTVEIDGEELPGLDGSSLAYVNALRESGLIVQSSPRKQLVIDQTFRLGDASGWIEASPSRSRKSNFEYRLSFDHASPIPNQSFRVELTPRRFFREVAPARTFVTIEQAEQIRASGVAKHVSNQDLLVIGDDGPIDNEYRFTNECARHKTLDLIGDLALANFDLVGNFVSFRGGHNLNGCMAKHLVELARAQSGQQPSAFKRREAA